MPKYLIRYIKSTLVNRDAKLDISFENIKLTAKVINVNKFKENVWYTP